MTHPLEEMSCELVVEVPSGEFMLTSSYLDEAPIVIEGNQMPGRNFFLDDSNVTSRVFRIFFRIFVDPVLSGYDGYREANVVSSACHRDREECRVLNATEVTVAFWWPPWGIDRLHVRHV
ncbi:hypothetical protein Taro_054826 [Colocasia esculenta]|uniref:Uncharacterized protein n=1 Tax=Colocasia esculenta TaxID=4460 RepID=A0A843XRR4_COLES|nr:hypothetical protein [Colocasia esculenta]